MMPPGCSLFVAKDKRTGAWMLWCPEVPTGTYFTVDNVRMAGLFVAARAWARRQAKQPARTN